MPPVQASMCAAKLAVSALSLVALVGCGSEFSAASGGDGGTSGDAETTTDGAPASDGGSTSGDGGAHWCAGRTDRFCADFDESTEISAVLGSWSTYEQAGGTFTLDTGSDVPSPPNALMVAANGNAQALVIQAMPAIVTRPTVARLEFDLRIDDAGPVGGFSAAAFAAIFDGTMTADGVVSIAIGNGPQLSASWESPSDAGIQDGGAFGAVASAQPFPTLGVWSGRFAIEIDYGGTGAAKTACAQIFQGAMPLLPACTPLPLSFADPRQLSIAIGQYSAGLDQTGQIQIRFDNVTFNY